VRGVFGQPPDTGVIVVIARATLVIATTAACIAVGGMTVRCRNSKTGGIMRWACCWQPRLVEEQCKLEVKVVLCFVGKLLPLLKRPRPCGIRLARSLSLSSLVQ
jgi:hypothetical protein